MWWGSINNFHWAVSNSAPRSRTETKQWDRSTLYARISCIIVGGNTIIVLLEITTQRQMVASALNCYGRQSPVDLSIIMFMSKAVMKMFSFLLRDYYFFLVRFMRLWTWTTPLLSVGYLDCDCHTSLRGNCSSAPLSYTPFSGVQVALLKDLKQITDESPHSTKLTDFRLQATHTHWISSCCWVPIPRNTRSDNAPIALSH